MEIKSYQNQAELLVKEYLLADSVIPYTSVICGICACKMVYDLTQLFSNVYFKSYPGLSKLQRTEWSNRSALSTFTLGISLGYFLSDLAMIIWFYPFLGGMEYVLHHLLSVAGIANPMLTGEGQVYTFMVLISESTTPGINLRWYLDTAGMKRSRAYLINGVVMFVAWLVARILLFMYLFYHIYLHYDQVKQVNSLGQLLISIVPLVLSVMNLMWFGKIIKGLMKTLAKRH
ncbi:hypothetical protein ES288_A11G072000v1 [Gossypium darwinii]|uniref:TLC domain-containing protein n=2 Tax=Gossypium TaxID=3633 RepID=A0A5D2N6E9_GOSTO|nr:hypothetical protein ES288_A11G072000v1 [Gossypium darwinii]TYH99526.1 hypothetical protein ES332_A11G072200v1 [Gossypium tomentosum]TYH99527.1 hypothetical protein ES332_A11G072200v1 [Gossypium tomentosum]